MDSYVESCFLRAGVLARSRQNACPAKRRCDLSGPRPRFVASSEAYVGQQVRLWASADAEATKWAALGREAFAAVMLVILVKRHPPGQSIGEESTRDACA